MRASWWALVLLASGGCKKEADGTDVIIPEDTGPFFADVTVRFRVEAANVPFSCHSEFRYLGSTANAAVKFRGLWAYVSNVGLVDASGASTLLELSASEFQEGATTLLDFEDGAEYCEGGDAAVNVEVTGRVPVAEYTGLAFTLGIPDQENHSEAVVGETGPLHRPNLYAGSLYGHDFFHLDLTSTGEPDGYPIYVRASGCTVDDFGNYAGCNSPNVATFTLDTFNVETDTVVFDFETLLSRNNLDANATSPGGAQTAPGCQSDPTDPDCQAFFTSYGLTALPPTWVRAEQ